MQREEILSVFSESGALLTGHFILTSGLHSPGYLQCAQVQQYPARLDVLCRELALKWQGAGATVVIGPAMGGIVLAYELARHLGARGIFMERAADGKFELRRGWALSKEDRVLVAEDVVTTGGSALEVLEKVKAASDASVVGVTSLVCRNRDVDFGVDYRYLIHFEIPAYKSEECPLCKQGLPAVKPGSRPDKERAR
jgi:orotate phosphoribosyltransferase